MELTNFTINLNSFQNENKIFQPVLTHSVSKNAFLLKIKLMRNPENENKFNESYFKIEHLNNDLHYVNITNVRFVKKDNKGLPAFYVCLKVRKKPDYQVTGTGSGFILDLKPGESFRVHLDFTKNCSQGVANWNNFPCNTVKAL